MTMIKGMRKASRAVLSSLLMVAMLVYVFAIVLHSLLKDEEEVEKNFGTVGLCMWSLWMDGSLMDSTGSRLDSLMDLNQYHAILVFSAFMLLSAITLMNMLIGVLCEVVSAVGNAEKEDAAIALVRGSLLLMLKRLDEDGNGQIHLEEFETVFSDQQAQDVLRELQVDLPYLRDLSMMIYQQPDSFLSIAEIMDLILQCRGDRELTIKDLTDWLGFTSWSVSMALRQTETRIVGGMQDLAGLFTGGSVPVADACPTQSS